MRVTMVCAIISPCNLVSRTWTHDESGGEVPVRKTCVKVLVLVKSREGSSPYGRGLSMLANEGVCLRPQHLGTIGTKLEPDAMMI